MTRAANVDQVRMVDASDEGIWWPIRMVAIDLDGTLLDDSKKISEQTAGALGCLPLQDIRVVIASARPPRSVRQVYHALKLDTLQINYNGALIWDELKRSVV